MSVKIERQGVAALVIMNRPEVRNALGPQQCEELAAAIKEAGSDPEVKGVVVTGEGAFSGGGDIKGMVERKDMPAEERRKIVYSRFQGVIRTILELPVPAVAAIDGVAVGFGLDIAMACDSRFVGPDGWARQGWAKLGLLPGTGGILLLRHRAPGKIWKLIEDGRTLTPADMVELGLAEATDGATARERAVERIQRYAHIPAAALRGYAMLDRKDIIASLDQHLNDVLEVQMPLLTSPEMVDRINVVKKVS